jgi:hypothetical protein
VRDDQYARLKTLQEQLAEVVLVEANPAHWNGEGKPLVDLTREERGDRYWCKKNAAATLSVLMRLYNITGMIERAGPAPIEPTAEGESDLDKEVAKAEREAKSILNRLAKASRVPKT